MCRYQNTDRFFLVFSPLLFLIFNMIYWTYFQVWYGMVRYGMIWYGMLRYGMAWSGTG